MDRIITTACFSGSTRTILTTLDHESVPPRIHSRQMPQPEPSPCGSLVSSITTLISSPQIGSPAVGHGDAVRGGFFSLLRIPAPTHHPAAGGRPLRLPFHSVSIRPCCSAAFASSSPQQEPGTGDGDNGNGPTGVPVPFSRDAVIALPHKAGIMFVFCSVLYSMRFCRYNMSLLVCDFVNAGPLTSADLMGEASGEGLKVAYQGCPGAYSEAAAKKAYPSCETVPYEYFETAFQDPTCCLSSAAHVNIGRKVTMQ